MSSSNNNSKGSDTSSDSTDGPSSSGRCGRSKGSQQQRSGDNV